MSGVAPPLGRVTAANATRAADVVTCLAESFRQLGNVVEIGLTYRRLLLEHGAERSYPSTSGRQRRYSERSSHGSGYSPKRLILDVANKEGGAHLDPVRPARLQTLSEAVLPGRTRRPNIAVSTLSWEAIRQIAFEFEWTTHANTPAVAQTALGRESSYPANFLWPQGPIALRESAPSWKPFYPDGDLRGRASRLLRLVRRGLSNLRTAVALRTPAPVAVPLAPHPAAGDRRRPGLAVDGADVSEGGRRLNVRLRPGHPAPDFSNRDGVRSIKGSELTPARPGTSPVRRRRRDREN